MGEDRLINGQISKTTSNVPDDGLWLSWNVESNNFFDYCGYIVHNSNPQQLRTLFTKIGLAWLFKMWLSNRSPVILKPGINTVETALF